MSDKKKKITRSTRKQRDQQDRVVPGNKQKKDLQIFKVKKDRNSQTQYTNHQVYDKEGNLIHHAVKRVPFYDFEANFEEFSAKGIEKKPKKRKSKN
jgi:hypothetical protein